MVRRRAVDRARVAAIDLTAAGCRHPIVVQFEVFLDRLADSRFVVHHDNVLLTLHAENSPSHPCRYLTRANFFSR